MAQSTDINLPRNHIAVFPDQCVVCGHDNPNSNARIATGTLGWWTWLLWWSGKSFAVSAPACSGCAWRLQGLRSLSWVVTILIALAVLFYIWPYYKASIPINFHKWAMMVLVLICLIPQFIFEVCFARPFDITAYKNSVDYEFTSKEYAVNFTMLNIKAEWVKINGHNIKE